MQPVGSAATRAVRASALRSAVREAGFWSAWPLQATRTTAARFCAPVVHRRSARLCRLESAPAVACSMEPTQNRMFQSDVSIHFGEATHDEKAESDGPGAPALVRWD